MCQLGINFVSAQRGCTGRKSLRSSGEVRARVFEYNHRVHVRLNVVCGCWTHGLGVVATEEVVGVPTKRRAHSNRRARSMWLGRFIQLLPYFGWYMMQIPFGCTVTPKFH